MINLDNKTAIITGAGSGFGAGIAHTFAQAGAQVGVLDLNADAARAVAKQIGQSAIALTANVTNRQQLEHAVQHFHDAHQQVDIVVNNAGIGLTPSALEEVSEDKFQQIFEVNMRSIFYMSQFIVPIMKKQKYGSILNIASTAGISPRPGLSWYNASKGWVITATKTMAVELASANIRVNALNPVAGDTPMLSTFLGEDTAENRQKFLDTIPLGRFSTPQDLAHAALYLCSDAASLVTGVALEVDGGRCI